MGVVGSDFFTKSCAVFFEESWWSKVRAPPPSGCLSIFSRTTESSPNLVLHIMYRSTPKNDRKVSHRAKKNLFRSRLVTYHLSETNTVVMANIMFCDGVQRIFLKNKTKI